MFRRVGPGSCPGMPGLVLEWLWLLGGPWLSVAWAVGRFSVVGCFRRFWPWPWPLSKNIETKQKNGIQQQPENMLGRFMLYRL